MVERHTMDRRKDAPSLGIGVLAAAVLALFLAAPARGGVFVFGDSISDTGNGCLLPFVLAQQRPTSVTIPDNLPDECRDARYFLGRITHGPVWAEVFASGLFGTPLFGSPLHTLVPEPILVPFFPDEMLIGSSPPAATALLGLAPQKLFVGGANLAVGGAETEDLLGPNRSLDPLASEVGAFLFLVLQAQAIEAGPDDEYAIWIGGNDIRRQIKDGVAVRIEEGIARIVATIRTLQVRVGAQRFLIPNLPDVGLSADLDAKQRRRATFATRRWNRTLEEALDALDDPGVTRLDAFCLTDALIFFEKLDTDLTCLDSDRYPGCDGLLLFDDIHATALLHRSFGIAAQAALACRDEAAGHGRQRRCVTRFTRKLVRQGLLTRQARRAINHCVERKRHRHGM